MLATTRRTKRLVASMLVLSACGGGTPTSPPPPPPPPPPPAVASVVVATPATVLTVGGSLQLRAEARDAAGTVVAAAAITWSSSAGGVATVTNAGKVDGVAAGQATITAAAGGQSAQVAVAVRDTTAVSTTLSGTVSRVNLTLAAGTTYRIAGKTILYADSTLRLDGQLEVGPADSVFLYGSHVIINGAVTPSPTNGLARAGLRGPARSAGGDDSEPISVLLVAGNAIDVVGTLQGPDFIAITSAVPLGAPPGPPSRVTIRASVIGRDGADGTRAAIDGEPGGPVGIGSDGAKGTVVFFRPDLESRPIDQLRIETPPGGPATLIRGGTGGNGFSIRRRGDAVPFGANGLLAFAGSGGTGGAVTIAAGSATSVAASSDPGPFVRGGKGGAGGEIVLVGSESLRDGSGPAFEGESLDGTTGSGGTGGALAAPAIGGPAALEGGASGSAGSVAVEGGNGIDGGAGGEVKLHVGAVGPALGFGVAPPPPPAAPEATLTRAGNGGSSDSRLRAGGSARKIEVLDRLGGAPPVLSLFKLANVGNGGAGFNGCEVIPFINGTPGGFAAAINSMGAPYTIAEPAFRGGAGGDGVVPGTGGPRGFDEFTGTPIGATGANGRLCGSGLMVTKAIDFSFSRFGCNHPTGSLEVTSQLPSAVTVTADVIDISGTSGFRLADPEAGLKASATIQVIPNGKTQLGFEFNPCAASDSFSAEVRFRIGTGMPFGTTTVTGTVR